MALFGCRTSRSAERNCPRALVFSTLPTTAVLPARPASSKSELSTTGRPYRDSDRHISHETRSKDGRQPEITQTVVVRAAAAAYVAMTSPQIPNPLASAVMAAAAYARDSNGAMKANRKETRLASRAPGTMEAALTGIVPAKAAAAVPISPL